MADVHLRQRYTVLELFYGTKEAHLMCFSHKRATEPTWSSSSTTFEHVRKGFALLLCTIAIVCRVNGRARQTFRKTVPLLYPIA